MLIGLTVLFTAQCSMPRGKRRNKSAIFELRDINRYSSICRSALKRACGPRRKERGVGNFTVATNVKGYFCDPQGPWLRGTNENWNPLLRQYFPKRSDLSGYTQAEFDKVALRLNQRPRKTLGFETPASRLQASVATTH
jgi:hypothetical protein